MPPKKNIEKRIILPATDKGGVGKSFFCVQLCDWLRRYHPDRIWQAFDPDASNLTLERFFPEQTKVLDVTKDGGLDPIFLALADTDIVISDGVGSQQTSVFQKWIEEIDLHELTAAGNIGLTYYLVVEDSSDVIKSVERTLKSVGNLVDWLLIRNLKQSKELSLWDKSDAYELFRQLGGREIVFCKVTENLRIFYDAEALPFSECAESPDTNILDRQRFKTLMRGIDEQFRSVESILVPKKSASQGTSRKKAASGN